MVDFSVGSRWLCEYCGTYSLLGAENRNQTIVPLNGKSKHGDVAVRVNSVSCANETCRELSLVIDYGDYQRVRVPNSGSILRMVDWEVSWSKQLLPDSVSVSVPLSVPAEIAITYKEAAMIADISGRASAAMSRRCLQGMVRDFFDIPANKRGNLGAELSFVKDRIDPDMWENLLAVRSVGDIGAHMDHNVDQIIDISPEEARILLALIESLFKEWYEAREKRQRSSSQLKELLTSKRMQQKEAKQKSTIVTDGDSEDQ